MAIKLKTNEEPKKPTRKYTRNTPIVDAPIPSTDELTTIDTPVVSEEKFQESDGVIKEGIEVNIGEQAEIQINPTIEELKQPIVRKIRLLIPIFGENIGAIIEESYKYFPEYVGFIERKATRMGNLFAEYVE